MARKSREYKPSSSSRVCERLHRQREFGRSVGEVFPDVRSITINATLTNFDVQKWSESKTLRVAPEDKFPLHIACICNDCEDGGESHASGIYFKRDDFEDAIADKKQRIEIRSGCHGWSSFRYIGQAHCSVIFEGAAEIEYDT